MSRLVIETKKYKSIPFCEYFLEEGCNKTLVFIQHGFQSNKEYGSDFLALTLARKGHRVIALDAYKHGERIEEPYITQSDALRYSEIFHVVDQTSSDIVELYKEKYSKEYSAFDMIGVSMGGFIAYSVALKTDKVNKLVPTITTPMFSKLARTRHNVPDVNEYLDEISPHLDFVDTIDVHSKKENLKYQELFIVSGERDPIIPVEDSKVFFDQLNDPRARIQVFDEVHEVNREMQKAIFDFITNEKAAL